MFFCCVFSLHTFRYKGLLNCAGEHRGELCWESTDFWAERPRPALLLLLLLLFRRCVDFGLQRATALITREMADFSLCAFFAAPGADLGSIKSGFFAEMALQRKDLSNQR